VTAGSLDFLGKPLKLTYTHVLTTDLAVTLPALNGTTFAVGATYSWQFTGGPTIVGTVSADLTALTFTALAAILDPLPRGTPMGIFITAAGGHPRLPWALGTLSVDAFTP